VTGNQSRQSKLIASLLTPEAYPHPAASPKLLETHISWVILTGTNANKIKKSVKRNFLDFSTLQQRRHFCEQALRLNRRMAPQLYLDVVAICGSQKNPKIGGDGTTIEYALTMHQFRHSAQLYKQLNAGLLNENDIRDLGATITAYHHDAVRLDIESDQESLRQINATQLGNFPPIDAAIDMKSTRRVQDWTSACGTRRPKPTHPPGPIRPGQEAGPFPSTITRYRISPAPMSEDRIRPGKGRIVGIQLSDAAQRTALPHNHAATTSAPKGTCSFRMHTRIQHPLSIPEAAPTR
jgi:hypothetical protein